MTLAGLIKQTQQMHFDAAPTATRRDRREIGMLPSRLLTIELQSRKDGLRTVLHTVKAIAVLTQDATEMQDVMRRLELLLVTCFPRWQGNPVEWLRRQIVTMRQPETQTIQDAAAHPEVTVTWLSETSHILIVCHIGEKQHDHF